MLHAIDRFVVHFFSSAGALLLALFTFRYLCRRLDVDWLPSRLPAQIVFVALGVFSFATLREAWDVAHGQVLAKAITDYVSWGAGLGCSAYGLLQLSKEKD